jgi:acyl-CoA thioester hydrolase
MIHHCLTHVRWDDLDAFGHVNNASYLTYAQESRSDFLWFSRQSKGQEPILAELVVARAEVDFIEPIYEGGIDVDVAITVSRIGNSSFELNYVISREGMIFAKVKTVQVTINMDSKKSRPLKDDEREFLKQYLENSSEGKI